MANKIGVSEATVQRYESGKITKVPYKAIIAYADTFKVSPSYIMGWSETPGQYSLFDAFEFNNEDPDKIIDTEDINAETAEERVIVKYYRDASFEIKKAVQRILDCEREINMRAD